MIKKLIKQFLKLFSITLLVVFVSAILFLALRGKEGNPTSKELVSRTWMDDGPLELSPERGRYALLYSIVEDKSLIFDVSIARLATPDLGIVNGNYVSLFAPLVSFIMIPGYIIGKSIGLAQVGGFAMISLFALANVFLLRAIAIRLGSSSIAATLASLVFIFGSPAFSYAVTLYQHHISTFLILSSIYVLLKWNNWLSLSLFGLLFAASITVDYPNLILMLPIALYAAGRVLRITNEGSGFKFNIKVFRLLTPIAMLIPLLFYVWFSQGSYNKPFQLSGTVKSVRAIDEQGRPTEPLIINEEGKQVKEEKKDNDDKSAVNFFKTRNLLNGFYIHFLSRDRGIIYYAPIVLFGFIGLLVALKMKAEMISALVGVIGANVLLYSLWGDAWGGWAFGSRYLIPTYAILSIFIALLLTYWRKKKLFIILFLSVALYSIAVNTLGAITTNTNPPKGEAEALSRITNRIEKYSFDRNIDYLKVKGSKSFVYQTYLSPYITPVYFYYLLTGSIFILVSSLTFAHVILSRRKEKSNV